MAYSDAEKKDPSMIVARILNNCIQEHASSSGAIMLQGNLGHGDQTEMTMEELGITADTFQKTAQFVLLSSRGTIENICKTYNVHDDDKKGILDLTEEILNQWGKGLVKKEQTMGKFADRLEILYGNYKFHTPVNKTNLKEKLCLSETLRVVEATKRDPKRAVVVGKATPLTIEERAEQEKGRPQLSKVYYNG
jgi:hypothetical protein